MMIKDKENANEEINANIKGLTVNEENFDSFEELLNSFDNNFEWGFYTEDSLELTKKKGRYLNVKKYRGRINYKSGFTSHYETSRIFRELELIKLLGKGKPIDVFIVDEENRGLQIQEILDNAIINIYSFDTHKKVTLFAPTPERICSLYEAIGETPPDDLILKSEENFKNGYNKIYCL